MDRPNRCQIATAVIFYCFMVGLLYASYIAVCSVSASDAWHAKDYWFAWFAALSLLGAAASTIIATVSLMLALNCPGEQR